METFLICYTIFIGLFVILSPWIIHVLQMKDEIRVNKIKIKFRTFFSFYKLFKKYEDKFQYEVKWPNSIFSEDIHQYKQFYLHAGIIIFENVGIILDPISIIILSIFNHSFIKI